MSADNARWVIVTLLLIVVVAWLTSDGDPSPTRPGITDAWATPIPVRIIPAPTRQSDGGSYWESLSRRNQP